MVPRPPHDEVTIRQKIVTDFLRPLQPLHNQLIEHFLDDTANGYVMPRQYILPAAIDLAGWTLLALYVRDVAAAALDITIDNRKFRLNELVIKQFVDKIDQAALVQTAKNAARVAALCATGNEPLLAALILGAKKDPRLNQQQVFSQLMTNSWLLVLNQPKS